MSSVFPDPATPFGERVARNLREERVVWLTTVGVDGTPQPNPVWFVREADTLLIYNQPVARRLEHIKRNPRVSLNFVGDSNGDDVIVLIGEATIESGQPLSTQVPAYVEKYGPAAAAISGDVTAFAESYSVAIRVRIDKVRGF